MLDSELVFNLKNKYGNLYSVEIKDTVLVFRELTFREYDRILHLQGMEEYSSADMEDQILKFTIVYPEDFDIYKIPAGNISSLAESVLDISGITSVKLAKQILEEQRAKANEVKSLMKAFVLAAIHHYSPEQLEEMTFSELSEKVALAEKIIEIRQGMNGIQPNNLVLQLIDPEEELQKEKMHAARHNLSKKEGEAAYEDPIAQKLWGMR